jgi:allophanate hydrolase
VQLAVCGAHLSGQPLNHQLIERGAVLLCSTTTAPNYRLFALDPGQSGRPGLLRGERGAAIEVEVWELPARQVGSFVNSIKAPLGFGRIELTDGTDVLGFLCEEYATHGAVEITEFGGWRAYLANIAA